MLVGKRNYLFLQSITICLVNQLKKVQDLFLDEVLQKQIDLGIERDGFPRVDLLDTTAFPDRNGFTPDIRWLVFKVKKRGKTNYTSMILSEINGGDDKTSFAFNIWLSSRWSS